MRFEEKYNALFDKAILEDTSLPIKPITEIPFVEECVSDFLSIEFDSKPAYYYLSLLDSELYSDSDKIKIVEHIITHKDELKVSYLSDRKIDYWKKNPQALSLIENYFEELIHTQQENRHIKPAYLKFKVINQFDEAYDLIKNYFNDRDSLEKKNSYEGSFILELIRLTKLEEAADYLEIIINDYYDNKIEYLFIGTSLQQLCLCDNKKVREKSLDLLIKQLTFSRRGWNQPEVATAYHLNKEKVEELCIEKFKELKHIDLNDKQSYSKYKSHITFCRAYVSERIGKELWNDFLEKKSFIEKHEGSSFYGDQFNVLNAALNDRSLNFQDKLAMLFQVEQKENLFTDQYNKQGYINCIRKAFDGGIPDSDVLAKLNISFEDYLTFEGFPLMDYQRILNPETIVKDLIATTLLPSGSSVDTLCDFSAFESFLKSNTWYQFHNSTIDKYLFQTGFVKRIFLEPLNNYDNFKNVFNLYFKPLLEQIGITDIDVVQKTEFKENGIRQSVVVMSNTSKLLFKVVYSHKTNCPYDCLAKAINIILIEKNVKQRFIESATLDGMQRYQEYIFFEPAKVRAFYDLYELGCWAINYNDVFSNSLMKR